MRNDAPETAEGTDTLAQAQTIESLEASRKLNAPPAYAHFVAGGYESTPSLLIPESRALQGHY